LLLLLPPVVNAKTAVAVKVDDCVVVVASCDSNKRQHNAVTDKDNDNDKIFSCDDGDVAVVLLLPVFDGENVIVIISVLYCSLSRCLGLLYCTVNLIVVVV
jgi:hypothetical protein